MKTKVKLGLKEMNVPELLGFATHAVTKMTGNTLFPSPPALDKVTNAITELQNALNLAIGGGPAQTAVLKQNRVILETLLTGLGHYVEDIANDPANGSSGAEAIILNSGLDVKQFHPRQKQTFSVSAGGLPGTVALSAESVKRGSHEWQYSPDASPNVWVDAEPTVQATTAIKGLESGKRYSFRHRSVLSDGPTAWCDPESILVH